MSAQQLSEPDMFQHKWKESTSDDLLLSTVLISVSVPGIWILTQEWNMMVWFSLMAFNNTHHDDTSKT